MIDIERIAPKSDNILVRLDIHERRTEERRTEGGIVIPDMEEWEYTLAGEDKRAVKTPGANVAQQATVIAAGPGHWHDKWLGLEQGTSPDGRNIFVPMNPDLCHGTRVLLEDARIGDRLYATDYSEYRMVREHNVIAVLEEE